MNKAQLSLQITESGRPDLESKVRLDDILTSLESGSYTVYITKEQHPHSIERWRNLYFAKINQLIKETGNEKQVLKQWSAGYAFTQMMKTPEHINEWVDLSLVKDGDLSVRYLTLEGWPIFYQHVRRWAYDTFESILS